MNFDVNKGNVEWVTRSVLESVNGGRFNLGEVLLGLADAMGRTIVGVSDNPVTAMSVMGVIIKHTAESVRAGMTAKGYNMGDAPINLDS